MHTTYCIYRRTIKRAVQEYVISKLIGNEIIKSKRGRQEKRKEKPHVDRKKAYSKNGGCTILNVNGLNAPLKILQQKVIRNTFNLNIFI